MTALQGTFESPHANIGMANPKAIAYDRARTLEELT